MTEPLAPVVVSNFIFDRKAAHGMPASSNLSGGARFTLMSDSLSPVDVTNEISASRFWLRAECNLISPMPNEYPLAGASNDINANVLVKLCTLPTCYRLVTSSYLNYQT